MSRACCLEICREEPRSRSTSHFVSPVGALPMIICVFLSTYVQFFPRNTANPALLKVPDPPSIYLLLLCVPSYLSSPGQYGLSRSALWGLFREVSPVLHFAPHGMNRGEVGVLQGFRGK